MNSTIVQLIRSTLKIENGSGENNLKSADTEAGPIAQVKLLVGIVL